MALLCRRQMGGEDNTLHGLATSSHLIQELPSARVPTVADRWGVAAAWTIPTHMQLAGASRQLCVTRQHPRRPLRRQLCRRQRRRAIVLSGTSMRPNSCLMPPRLSNALQSGRQQKMVVCRFCGLKKCAELFSMPSLSSAGLRHALARDTHQ